ncbi:MAG TPA: class I SAM-dependent methyltransferase [Gemmatimonadaceae bacterium]
MSSAIDRLRRPFQVNDQRLRALVERHNDAFFSELNVSREDATARHVAASKAVGLDPAQTDSVHRLAFAALAVSGFTARNVLEIGTYLGETSRYLAELFPTAEIYTVELPGTDPIYRAFHPELPEQHEATLRAALNRPNIRSLRLNSATLFAQPLPEFDLIWLDGGHTYPEVAWDHAYSLAKLVPGGWLFSDDVVLPGNPQLRRRPDLLDVYETLSYLGERQLEKFRYLLKREEVLSYLTNPKYIAYLQKSSAA